MCLKEHRNMNEGAGIYFHLPALHFTLKGEIGMGTRHRKWTKTSFANNSFIPLLWEARQITSDCMLVHLSSRLGCALPWEEPEQMSMGKKNLDCLPCKALASVDGQQRPGELESTQSQGNTATLVQSQGTPACEVLMGKCCSAAPGHVCCSATSY